MKRDPTQIDYGDHFSFEKLTTIFTQISDHAAVKVLLSGGAAFFQWTFGGNVQGLAAVTCLIFIDTISGACKAYKAGKLSSHGFFRFALKCTVYLLLIATASLVDKTLPVGFASVIMITFLAATEAISIMENMRALGFSVPSVLVSRLKTLKGEEKTSVEPESQPISTHH
jgi:toxin secretion/phage lysis holin